MGGSVDEVTGCVGMVVMELVVVVSYDIDSQPRLVSRPL